MSGDRMRARVYRALSRGLAGTGNDVPHESLTWAVEEVLGELSEDLVDEDAPPPQREGLPLTVGAARERDCPACGWRYLYYANAYAFRWDHVVRVGEIKVCRRCFWSPHGTQAT